LKQPINSGSMIPGSAYGVPANFFGLLPLAGSAVHQKVAKIVPYGPNPF
jgi:hypothetical protein